MRRLLIGTAIVLITSSAGLAEPQVFKFGGHVMRMEVPGNCRDFSCASNFMREHLKGKKATAERPGESQPAPEQTAVAPDSSQPTNGTGQYPAAGEQASRPASPSARVPGASPERKSEPVASSTKTPDMLPPAAPWTGSADVSPERKPDPVTSAARLPGEQNPPARIAANDPTSDSPVPAGNATTFSPLGMWLTPKGQIRIEECGQALCGIAVGKANEKILSGMKPTQKNRWDGTLYDPEKGNTYTSHMTQRDPNTLRVEGCAMGGLFCRTQKWTRVE